VAEGPVILLQPRRVAVRAIASRIAAERGWVLGREVGWHMRFERRFTAATRLLVATEGILTARLQRDPLLSEFQTVVLDEFHERSIHADVAIALARQAWLARADLRVLVMSATLDGDAVASFLGNCPTIRVPGALHPVTIEHAPGISVAAAACDLLSRSDGDVLCFLPGALEIRRAIDDAAVRVGPDADVLPLYGALPAHEQDRIFEPASGRRRIIVATNLAETSVTVPRVTAVVDSGLQKVARYDAARAIDTLSTERITQDSADQRAGRAGRIGPGLVARLWDSRARLRPHREPDIHRIDLSAPVLDVLAWGGDPLTFEWFEAPRPEALRAALALLTRLGAIQGTALTDTGAAMHRLPVAPRLARMLIAAGFAADAIRACAIISERQWVPRPQQPAASTASDLLTALDEWPRLPEHVRGTARAIEQMIRAAALNRIAPRLSADAFCRAALAGYPDRVAQRRTAGSPKMKMMSGAGAVLSEESGVRNAEFLVAIDLHEPDRAARVASEPRIRIAAQVEREWLQPDRREVVHRLNEDAGTVSAVSVEAYGALILRERPAAPDPETVASLLSAAWLSRGPTHEDMQLLRRLHFIGAPHDVAALARAAAMGAGSVRAIRLVGALPFDLVRRLEREAPATLAVPSGRQVRLEYQEDGGVRADVKLQELFGLADTPRIGPHEQPVLIALLAPNGRPVQLTRDLRSFWTRTYPEVRRELRGRYPKHPWPEDPWTAPPTRRKKMA
jgi:ATP-dependent helicase HrpB